LERYSDLPLQCFIALTLQQRRVALGGSAAPPDDAKNNNAALPPKLASSKGLLDPHSEYSVLI